MKIHLHPTQAAWTLFHTTSSFSTLFISTTDIDECEENAGRGPCADTCHNLAGSYACSCRPGSSLAPDNHTCTLQESGEGNACSHGNAGCSHMCLASMGRVFCLCPDGFMLEDDWKTCQGEIVTLLFRITHCCSNHGKSLWFGWLWFGGAWWCVPLYKINRKVLEKKRWIFQKATCFRVFNVLQKIKNKFVSYFYHTVWFDLRKWPHLPLGRIKNSPGAPRW